MNNLLLNFKATSNETTSNIFNHTFSIHLFSVELNWYSFVVLPTLSLSLCLAIVQRNRLVPNLITVHQFICLFLISIYVLPLSVYYLNPTYLALLFEICIAVALLNLIVIIVLRISTKDDKKVKAYKLLLQYTYLIFCFQMFPLIVSY